MLGIPIYWKKKRARYKFVPSLIFRMLNPTNCLQFFACLHEYDAGTSLRVGQP